jgi:hypothetical protein
LICFWSSTYRWCFSSTPATRAAVLFTGYRRAFTEPHPGGRWFSRSHLRAAHVCVIVRKLKRLRHSLGVTEIYELMLCLHFRPAGASLPAFPMFGDGLLLTGLAQHGPSLPWALRYLASPHGYAL